MNPEAEYLTKQHAELVFDLKSRKLERAYREGKVRAFRIGRKILIEKASIVAWLESNEITPTDRAVTKSALQELMDAAIAHARRKGAA